MDNINAINNFFYFSMNYRSDYHEWDNFGIKEVTLLPDFIVKVKWSCNLQHIIGKWLSIEETNAYGRINRFYADLDNKNRRLMLEWITEHYNSGFTI